MFMDFEEDTTRYVPASNPHFAASSDAQWRDIQLKVKAYNPRTEFVLVLYNMFPGSQQALTMFTPDGMPPPPEAFRRYFTQVSVSRKGTNMFDSQADLLRRVLTQIAAQREHLHPDASRQEHADRYHELLDRLAAAGYDVDEFRLDFDRDMFVRSTGRDRTGPKYESTKTVRFGVLEQKMDALLSYFRLDAEQAPIGFDLPRKR